MRKALQLVSAGAAGDRTIDISVQSRIALPSNPVSSPISPATQASLPDTGENLQTLIIPAVLPLKITQNTSYKRRGEGIPGLARLSTFDKEFWDDSAGGEALVRTTVECVGPWSLVVENIKFIPEVRLVFFRLDDIFIYIFLGWQACQSYKVLC